MTPGEPNNFDRLAGQPNEPSARLDELVAGAKGDMDQDSSLDLGDLNFTGITRMSKPPGSANPLPWVLAIVLGIIAGVLLFAFVLPGQVEIKDAQDELENARQKLSLLQMQLERLESEKLKLEESLVGALAESEKRAEEEDESKRQEEVQSAEDKRKNDLKAALNNTKKAKRTKKAVRRR